MLQTVHTKTRCNHQNRDKYHWWNQLLAFLIQNISDNMKGIIIRIHPEQAENPHNPYHAECNGSRREENRQIIGQPGKNIYNSHKRQHIFSHCTNFRHVLLICKQKPGSKNTQKIICRKTCNRNPLNPQQNASILCPYPIIGIHDTDH